MFSFTDFEESKIYINVLQDSFLKTLKIGQYSDINEIIIRIIKDPEINDYSSLIPFRFIQAFSHEEILKILRNKDVFKNFLISIMKPSISHTYFKKFGELFTPKLREWIVEIISDLQFKRVFDKDGNLTTKLWNLFLNLEDFEWYQYFKKEQLIKILKIFEMKSHELTYYSFADKIELKKKIQLLIENE